MKKLSLLFIFTVLLIGCTPGIIREKPVSQATPQNLASQADIDYARNFTEGVFSEDEWKNETTIHEDRVMNTWQQNNAGNLAYLDYRIYPEGYTQETLDRYYSDENFNDILYSYYADLQRIASCTKGSLMLYEFSASYMNTPYLIHDWVDTGNPNRIADFSMIFKESDRMAFENYAERLFPALPRCR
jgi:hypothetical protein